MKLRILLFFVFVSFGSTVFAQTEGCMNPYACNYDSLATVDNGSCSESLVYKAIDFQAVLGGAYNSVIDEFGNSYNSLSVFDTLQISGFEAPPQFYDSLGMIGGVYNTQTLIVKYNSLNELIWTIPIYSLGFEGVYQLSTDSSNNLYIAGFCGKSVHFGADQYLANATNNSNVFFAKIKQDGTIEWIRFVETTGTTSFASVVLDVNSNGQAILNVGCYGEIKINDSYYTFSPGFKSYWNSNGDLLTIFGSNSYYMPSSISDSGVSYVSNYTSGYIQNFPSSSISKYDENYDLVWEYGYYANDGSAPIVSQIESVSDGEFLVLFNSNTDTLFLETAAGLIHLINPNFVWDSITGVSNNIGSFFLVKLSTDGLVIWSKRYFGTGSIWGNYISLSHDRDEIVVVGDLVMGSDYSFDGQVILNPGDYNFFISKYDLEGNQVYLATSITTTVSSCYWASLDNYGQIKAFVRVENEMQFGDVIVINPDPSNIPITGGQLGVLTIGYSNELGCTDSFACNYDPGAGCDNGTCLYPGCTDVAACNYNSFAGCDDGLCDYHLVDIAPPICLVTVDEVSGHNMIVWEVPNENQIDQYLVFKETNMLNNYIEIGQVSVNELGEFIDVNSNPQVQANKYKLAVIDSCGATSEKCESHKTVHLSANFGIGGVINLAWTNYEGLSFSSYNIYRGNPTLGFNIIGSVPSNQTSFTDISPSSVEYVYYIEVGDISCNSDRTIVSSKSNYLNVNPDNIDSSSTILYFNVYCSVSNSIMHLSASEAEIGREFSVLNSTGSLVYSGRVLGSQSQHDLSGLSNGVYVFRSGEYSKQFMLLR